MSNQNIVTKRFIKLFEKLKNEGAFKSNAAFAKSIDYLPQAFNEIEKGRRDVPLNVLYNFIKEYKINPALIFNDNIFETQLENNSLYRYDKFNIQILPIAVDENNNERVVLVDKKAAAGYLQGFQEESFMKKLPTVSLPPGLEHKSLYGFQIEGDSMEGNLYDGDWAFCSLVEKLQWVKLNQIHIVVCEEGIVAKRIQEVDEEQEVLRVSSDNPIYPPYNIPLKEVKQVWYLEKALTGKFPIQENLKERLLRLEKRLYRG